MKSQRQVLDKDAQPSREWTRLMMPTVIVMEKKRKKWFWSIPIFVILMFCSVFLVYTEQYYHADAAAFDALRSDDTVKVQQTDYGWFFDGPSETDAMIFYPGAKVEETAYAPLLHYLAGQGMDVCLVKMPFRLAVFGANKADHVMKQHDYVHWYIGGHSFGGTVAANYAAEHSSQLSGVFMLAAYPSKQLDENTQAIIIYGSEDGVLNMAKLAAADQYLPDSGKQYMIEGGNHAQFGNYGAQDHKELHNLFKRCLVIMIVTGIIMMISAELLAYPLSYSFASYDPELLSLTTHAYRIYALSFAIVEIGIFGSNFFTALNNGLISGTITFMRVLVFELIAIYSLPLLLGLDGIWWGMVAARSGAAVLATIFFIANKKKYRY